MNYLKILIFAIILLCTLQAPCAAHYYLNNDTCLPCDSKCYQCMDSFSNCTSCQQKYFLQNTSCFSCPQICASCTSNLVCTNCVQGYFLQSSKCTGCSNNCAICNSTTVCTVCKVGYDIRNSCRTCAQSFYWNQTRKTCDRCALGCFQCTSTLYCQSCYQFYTYQSGICTYTGISQSESLSPFPSDNTKKIIIGIIVGGICIIGIIFYIAYRVCFKKQKPRLKEKIKNMSSNAKMVQSQSMSIEDQTSSINIQNCIYCNKSKAQKRLKCGHYLDHSCLQPEEPWCSICDLKPQQKQVYFDEIMANNSQFENNSQMNSQTTSQQPKNNAYMQSQMKESQMMDNIIQIEQQQQ